MIGFVDLFAINASVPDAPHAVVMHETHAEAMLYDEVAELANELVVRWQVVSPRITRGLSRQGEVVTLPETVVIVCLRRVFETHARHASESCRRRARTR